MKSLIKCCSQYIHRICLTIYYRRFYCQNLSSLKKGRGRTPTDYSELILGIQQLGIYTKLPHKRQSICDALRNLILIVQFKKCEKHPWGSVTFSKVEDFNTF